MCFFQHKQLSASTAFGQVRPVNLLFADFVKFLMGGMPTQDAALGEECFDLIAELTAEVAGCYCCCCWLSVIVIPDVLGEALFIPTDGARGAGV